MIEITKTVCELLGDITDDGYNLKVDNQDVPIFIGKDDTTVYPQIRITPDIDGYDAHHDKYINESRTRSIQHRVTVFQIDIFSKSLIELDKIKKMVDYRRYHFFNIEFMDFEYTKDFAYNDDYYFNPVFSDTDHCYRDVAQIRFDDNNIIQKVSSLDNLDEDCWYMNEDGLYIKLSDKYDIKDIKVTVLQQGFKFQNGDLIGDRRIIDYKITRKNQTTELEKNEVERYSFDLALLYSEEYRHNSLPLLQDIKIGYDYNEK